MPRSTKPYWVFALILAWGFDLLVWDTPLGVNYMIWMVAAVAAVFLLAFQEKIRPAPASYPLAVAIILLAAVNVLRNEPLTMALSGLGAFALLVLLVLTLRNGNWLRYRIGDYPVAFVRMIGALLSRGATWFPRTPAGQERPSNWRRAVPYLRGIILAVPILLIFGALLSSADLVFSSVIQNFFKAFDLANLPEYIWRLFYILVFAYVFVGALSHAVLPAHETEPDFNYGGGLKPFLGATESFIVLGAVNLLFILFVVIQFRYLFGGQANITAAGFTYADYARRGFGELVGVAVISLALFLTLAGLTRLESKGQKRAFTILSVLLLGLVLVMMASALQRVLLYQDAYGFTRVRTYTLFFIPWLAALLLAAIGLQLAQRRGRFALALLVFCLGFVLTLAGLNTDAFIVHQNVSRARAGEELDMPYLVTLSSDAVPALFDELNASQSQPEVQQKLVAALSCRLALAKDEPAPSWRGYRTSPALATRLLSQNAELLADYPVKESNAGSYDYQVTMPGGKQLSCYNWQQMD